MRVNKIVYSIVHFISWLIRSQLFLFFHHAPLSFRFFIYYFLNRTFERPAYPKRFNSGRAPLRIVKVPTHRRSTEAQREYDVRRHECSCLSCSPERMDVYVVVVVFDIAFRSINEQGAGRCSFLVNACYVHFGNFKRRRAICQLVYPYTRFVIINNNIYMIIISDRKETG